MVEDGWLAPTTLSFLFVSGVFVLAGCLHPQEFWCLPMGIIYYVTIPSMYLFLIIYAVFNLHVVSWGTREVPKKKSLEELEAEKKAAEEEAKKPPPKKKGIMGWFQKDRWLQYSMSNMFNGKQGLKGNLDEISRRLDGVERALRREGYEMPRIDLEEEERKKKEEEEIAMKKKREEEEQSKMRRQHTVRIVEPNEWIQDEDLGHGPRRALPRRETKFWIAMIEKYLKPLIKDKEKEEAVGRGLKELRNQMVFSFLMINGLWVVTVFLMQENQDKIYIEWPWGAKGPSVSYSENLGQITLVYDYLQLEPIGLVFLLFFAIVLLIQLIGMLIHRVMTLAHILATTEVRGAWRKRKGYDEKADLQKNGVNIIKDMQRQFKVNVIAK